MAYKIAVLTGGASPLERRESQASAAAMCAALHAAGHQTATLHCDGNLVSALRAERPDAACIAVHGSLGENGTLQGLLALLGIPFVGSPEPVCRALRNRAALADVLDLSVQRGEIDAQAPTTICLTRTCFEELGAFGAHDLIEGLMPGGYPVCVKPACGNDAQGISRVDAPEQFEAAVRKALAFDDEVVVQEWEDGVELTVYVLGDAEDLQVLPPVEIVPRSGAPFDETCREALLFPEDQTGQGSPVQVHVPVRLESLAAERGEADAIRSEIERTAVDAYLACGCRDWGRVDMVWDGGRARIIELGLVPSLAPGALLARAANAAQIELSDVLDALVRIAVERG